MNRIRKCELCECIKTPQEMFSMHICKECIKKDKEKEEYEWDKRNWNRKRNVPYKK